ncbi:MAG: glutathione S-transferase family protein [Myxococcales bacterium]|nr:glutathione S-transferase family protein [Myxococcales bacterium]
MALKLYYHPFSRAANTVWALEEVGCDYELELVDFKTKAHKTSPFLQLNPMGKLPTIVDGEVTVTEAAAIALYLADRYAPGKLAPATDSPERGAYLRWALYAPSVIEPGCMAQASQWTVSPSSAGFGTYTEMLTTISQAISHGPWLLGESFSMADVIFGGTLKYMLMFNIIEKRPEYEQYAERLMTRDAARKAEAINARYREEQSPDPS